MALGYLKTDLKFAAVGVLACTLSMHLAWGQTASEVIQKTGIKSGLAVQLGCGKGELITQLHNSGKMLVQGYDTDASKVLEARKTILDQGLAGLVTAEKLMSYKQLPYKNNMVNVLVADLGALGNEAPSLDEINRIIAPECAAYVKQGGAWKVIKKERPAGYGNWSQFYHGPDQNAVSTDTHVDIPKGIQWMAGFMRSGGTSAPRIWNRFYTSYDHQKGVESRRVGRDAFNGIALWTMPEKKVQSPFFSAGSMDGMVLSFPDKGEFMKGYDAETGEVKVTYTAGKKWPDRAQKNITWGAEIYGEIALGNGIVLQKVDNTLTAMEIKTGKFLWKYESDQFLALPSIDIKHNQAYIAKTKSNVYYARWPKVLVYDIVALDLKTGAKKWTSNHRNGKCASQIIANDDKVVIASHWTYANCKDEDTNRNRNHTTDAHVSAISASDGKPIWSWSQTPGGGHTYNTVIWKGAAYYHKTSATFRIPMDSKGELEITPKCSKHNREACLEGGVWKYSNTGCMRAIGTPKHLIFSHTMFADKFGSGFQSKFYRSSCAQGFYPANGILYAPQSGICKCINMWKTNHAFESQPAPVMIPNNKRLF